MQAASRRTIFHVDLDAYYVSVEAREDSSLRGRPVVVGADPEAGKGRGVVVTCSYEARRFGLKSGMPISRAWKLCPTAVYLRPRMELYERVSRQVMGTLKEFAGSFEQTGIDEAFLDVSGRVREADEARALASLIKEALKERHSLTCSIGVGPNKSTAKVASDLQKPDGLTIVPPDGAASFLAPLSVSVIPGVGKKTQGFLRDRGIEKVGDLQSVPGKQLMQWFGKTGVWLWGVVHAQEQIPVRPREMPKSLSAERTFREDEQDFGEVRQALSDAARELAGRVKKGGFKFRVAGIKIRFRGFQTYTREQTLPSFTDSEATLRETASALLGEFDTRDRAVRLIGVRVANIVKEAPETLC